MKRFNETHENEIKIWRDEKKCYEMGQENERFWDEEVYEVNKVSISLFHENKIEFNCFGIFLM